MEEEEEGRKEGRGLLSGKLAQREEGRLREGEYQVGAGGGRVRQYITVMTYRGTHLNTWQPWELISGT